MRVQSGRLVVHTFETTHESAAFLEQLADIGYADAICTSDPARLAEFVADFPESQLLLLFSAPSRCLSDVLDVINLARGLPVLGMFPRRESCWDPKLIELCHEVTTWPCDNSELQFRLRKLVDRSPIKQALEHRLFIDMQILGNSPAFREVLGTVNKLTGCDAPVLIYGETGSGKELIGRAIHYLGSRKDGPFIAVNCGAIPDQLVENEFFGHCKGAYTDASEASDGVIAQAEGGTLFLDEVEALSPKGQVTLLRFLDNMVYRPLGGTSAKRADLRVIAASNESILGMVKEGSFRKDLYYRINIMNVHLPALRERAEDIDLLAEYFMRKYQLQYSQPDKQLHPQTRAAMKYYDWPGNVRELENMLHREFLLADGKFVSIRELEVTMGDRRSNRGDRRMQALLDEPMSKAKHLLIEKFEQQYLSEALERAHGNVSEAARISGKERRSFTRLLNKYEIVSPAQSSVGSDQANSQP